MDLVRLACVRHAASVHPEPGSNSQIRCLITGSRPLVFTCHYCCFGSSNFFRSSFHGSDVLTSLLHQTRMKFKAKLYALYELNVQGCCAIQLSRCIAAQAAFNVCPEACPSVQTERRRRDLNPCAAINDLLPFQGSPFGQLGYFSSVL